MKGWPCEDSRELESIFLETGSTDGACHREAMRMIGFILSGFHRENHTRSLALSKSVCRILGHARITRY